MAQSPFSNLFQLPDHSRECEGRGRGRGPPSYSSAPNWSRDPLATVSESGHEGCGAASGGGGGRAAQGQSHGRWGHRETLAKWPQGEMLLGPGLP